MIKLIKEVPLWNSGYCQMWDFSEANASEANRIEAVTTVANVCRGDKGVKNPTELYQQLLTEHNGEPGSVFEFVPVIANLSICAGDYKRVRRFGISKGKPDGLKSQWLTNLRTMIPDVNSMNDEYVHKTEIEYNDKPIKDFFVFKIKVPQMIVKHILRHRMLSFQEMSERTNKLREYFYCDEFEPIVDKYGKLFSEDMTKSEIWNTLIYDTFTQKGLDRMQKEFKIRQELLNKSSHGLAYTTLWIAGWKQDLNGYQNFFNVRCVKPAQKEIIELATTMKNMMEE